MSKKFYTNYATIGNNLYIRGYNDGKPFSEKRHVKPTYYITDTKKQHNYKSIFGEHLRPVELESIKHSKEFLDTYRGTNITVCGNLSAGNQYMIENPSLTEYDIRDISLTFFDIEVQSREFKNRKKKIKCRLKSAPENVMSVSLLVFECYPNVNELYDVYDPQEGEWVDYWDSIYTEQGGFPEPADADHEVVSIAMHESKTDRYFVLGFGPNKWDKEQSILDKEILDKVSYFHCANELDLMNKWLMLMGKLNTDVLSGWHSGPFDVVYMYNRMRKLGIPPKRMSPWESCYIREFKDDWGNASYSVTIRGISNVDYKELFVKQAKPQPNYTLDNIAYYVLKKRKVEYEGSLFDLYDKDYNKFIDYNITDVSLLVEMEDKLRYFDAVYGVAYRTKSTFDETFGTIKVWENLVADGMWKDDVIPPAYRPDKYVGPRIAGGYVKDPKPAAYGWVESFDYASLYPKIMQMYNISPETLREKYGHVETNVDLMLDRSFDVAGTIDPDETLCASGYVFRTDVEGIFPKNMRELYAERKEMKGKQQVAKKREQAIKNEQRLRRGEDITVSGEFTDYTDKQLVEELDKAVFDKMYYNTQQMTMKILLNSGYGALGTNSFLYFDNRIAESVTISGQLGIRQAEKTLNNFMNKAMKTDDEDYVIAIDTDSCYLDVGAFVEKYCDPDNSTLDQITDKLSYLASEKIESALSRDLDSLKEYQQARVQGLEMDREVIASRAIWRKKKNYCMLVHDNEGVRYKKPEIKIMGLEAIKSSTPKLAREAMHEFIEIILTKGEDECQQFIKQFRVKYMNHDNITDLAYPAPMRKIKESTNLNDPSWSVKGTRANVHGAIVYNEILNQRGMTKTHETIKEDSRGYWVYLKQPNPANNSHTISFPEKIPEELGMERFVDRNKLFEKSFYNPIKSLMEPCGFQMEKRATLSGLFG